MDDVTAELKRVLDVPFTFSENCRSGLLDRCECWRCREGRGEPVTPESDAVAAGQAADADAAFRAANSPGADTSAHDLALDLWDRPPRPEVECDRCGDFAEPYRGKTCWKCLHVRMAWAAYRG